MADAIIQTHELTKTFHHPFFTWVVQARAVTDLTFSVERGEIFGLLGPNGSGKTTAIKMILGLLFPTRGHAAIFGRRPDDMEVKARLGFLPEESYLYRYLDAEETLDFYGRLFGLPRAERQRRTAALLDLVGLRKERRRPVGEFSKGMQRRLGLAQCLLNDPELVILDEPTSGLDPIGTREVKDVILQLKARGKTVLLSSHLLADVEDVCDRIIVLYGGRVLAAGRLAELLRQEHLLQVTAEMDSETVSEVCALIRRRRGESTEVSVSPLQERLESFFLRTIRLAAEQRLSTSGAEIGRGDLGFLPSGGPADILTRLTKAEAPAATPSSPAAALPPAEDALLRLTRGDEAAQPQPPAEASEAPTSVDRALLEKLAADEKRRGDG